MVATLVGVCGWFKTGATGGTESSVTATVATPGLPARSVAVTVRTLFPSARM